MSKKMIYVAGPISKGPIDDHVRSAIFAADNIMALGHAPMVPQLSILWQFISPHTWEEWLAMDEVFVERCDALLRMPGESAGADREVKLAQSLGKPVFFSEAELKRWLLGEHPVSSSQELPDNERDNGPHPLSDEAFFAPGGKL